MKNIKKYWDELLIWFWDILIWIDQGFNTFFKFPLNYFLNPKFKFGNPDETLSSVFGKNREQCRACYWICRALHLIDKNHCEESIEEDENGYENHS